MALKTDEQKDLLNVILNTVSDGITVIDSDLKIQYHNKIITRAFGPSEGQYCFKAYQGRKIPCENCVVLDVLKDGRERRGIVDIHLQDGTVRLLEVSSSAVKNAEGNIIGAVEIARDVTEQKQAEVLLNKTLLERNRDLKRLSSELLDAAGYVKTVLPQPLTSGIIKTDWKFIPSAYLGGDSFGYHWIDKDHFAIYLIDVSGHGWGAALFSVSIINALRSHSLPETDFRDPEQVLYALNEAFPSGQHNDMFFTIWYGVYRKSSAMLTYSSGGHPPAILISSTPPHGTPELKKLRTSGPIVGSDMAVRYEKRTKKIQIPSSLILLSDGVYEFSTNDGAIWGFDNLLKLIEQSSPRKGFYSELILSNTQNLKSGKAFDDDFTILEIVFNDKK
jgi:PAS domain S-box-containing protein